MMSTPVRNPLVTPNPAQLTNWRMRERPVRVSEFQLTNYTYKGLRYPAAKKYVCGLDLPLSFRVVRRHPRISDNLRCSPCCTPEGGIIPRLPNKSRPMNLADSDRSGWTPLIGADRPIIDLPCCNSHAAAKPRISSVRMRMSAPRAAFLAPSSGSRMSVCIYK